MHAYTLPLYTWPQLQPTKTRSCTIRPHWPKVEDVESLAHCYNMIFVPGTFFTLPLHYMQCVHLGQRGGSNFMNLGSFWRTTSLNLAKYGGGKCWLGMEGRGGVRKTHYWLLHQLFGIKISLHNTWQKKSKNFTHQTFFLLLPACELNSKLN